MNIQAFPSRSRWTSPRASYKRPLALSSGVAIAMFATLALRSTPASAASGITTYMQITNSTGATLTLDSVTNFQSCWVDNHDHGDDSQCPFTLGPPTVINPYSCASWEVQGPNPTDGTGGTIRYAIQNSGWFAQVVWSTPWVSMWPFNLPNDWSADASVVSSSPGGFQPMTEYQMGIDFPPNGTHVSASLVPANPPPQVTTMMQTANGVIIDGANFDITGLTNVTFGTKPAASVTCTSYTVCQAVAPAGTGTVPVTLGVMGKSVAAGNYVYPVAPGCTFQKQSSCGSEYVPAGYGTPVGYHTVETINATCPASASGVVAEEWVNGAWVSIAPFTANVSYPDTKVAGEFVVGEQSQGTTTSGAPIGSIQTVRTCEVSAAGAETCDAQSQVTITNCCVPATCNGSCGAVSDGCGGTLSCSCGDRYSCDSGRCMPISTCQPMHCPGGTVWDGVACACTCASPKCQGGN